MLLPFTGVSLQAATSTAVVDPALDDDNLAVEEEEGGHDTITSLAGEKMLSKYYGGRGRPASVSGGLEIGSSRLRE